MPSTTNIFIHDCIDLPRLTKLRALPDTRVDVIECDDEEENWHLPDDRASQTHLLVSCAAPDNLDAMSSLRLLQISSVGFGQLIGLRLAERGICACNAAGVFDVPIAEWNVAMMINLARDVLARSAPVQGDQPRDEVKWEQGNITELPGQIISLRFTLRNGHFYSYWFE